MRSIIELCWRLDAEVTSIDCLGKTISAVADAAEYSPNKVGHDECYPLTVAAHDIAERLNAIAAELRTLDTQQAEKDIKLQRPSAVSKKTRDWLEEIRGNRSQYKVAEEIGIAQSTYAAIEVGSRTPSVKMAKRIGAALGFDWTRFYEEEST